MSADEQGQLIHAATEVARGRIRIIAGAGSNSTQQAIELTRCVAAAGADAVLSVVPYYNRPMQSGIEAHFRAIAEATRLPIVLHYIPARTNRELTDTSLARLAQTGQFVGLKDGTGDISRVARLRRVLPEEFRLMSGDDPSALGFIASGGDGCISLISNIAPKVCREIFDYCRRENWKAARALHGSLAPLGCLLAKEGPSALKRALHELGLIRPQVRLPLVALDDATARDVVRATAAIGESAFAAP